MDYTSSRVFALTLAHRAVNDIKKDGLRQLRNYVDMCTVLCHSEMQKSFFNRAERVLAKTDNLYFDLIQQCIATVDEERICTVGVNIGYGGLIYGASKMKKQAEQDNKPFAWVRLALCTTPSLEAEVQKAEEQGCYIWMLHAGAQWQADVVGLAQAHPQSAFFVTVEPTALNDEAYEGLNRCKNLVPLLILPTPEMTESVIQTTTRMRNDKLFYGLVVKLDDAAAGQAMQREWLEVAAKQSLFCLYARTKDMTEAASQKLRKFIVHTRTEEDAPLLLLDWEKDFSFISGRISDKAVSVSLVPDDTETPLNG